MEQIITSIVSALSPSALPVVVLCLGGLYLYFKFGRMEKDRQETKAARDNDSQEKHDKLLTHDFKITNLQGITALHDTLLSDISKQINILSTNIAILSEKIDNLNNIIKESKSK